MISMVARVKRTFARFGEHIDHGADNHADEKTCHFVGSLKGFDCGLEAVDEVFGRVWFTALGVLYSNLSFARANKTIGCTCRLSQLTRISQSLRVAQSPRGVCIANLSELFRRERPDDMIHHRFCRAHHARDILWDGCLAGCLEAHKIRKKMRQKEPDHPARVEYSLYYQRGGLRRHGLSIGSGMRGGISSKALLLPGKEKGLG